MDDDFRFGDGRATDVSDERGGCCGKPIGCNIESDGCLRKPEKAEWHAAVEEELRQKKKCSQCGMVGGPYPDGDRPEHSELQSGCPRCGWCY